MTEIIIGSLCIAFSFILIFVAYRKFKGRRRLIDGHQVEPVEKDYSYKMLEMTRTNNNYEPLLDVLTSLDQDLSKLGMELNADMRGYLDYAERK